MIKLFEILSSNFLLGDPYTFIFFNSIFVYSGDLPLYVFHPVVFFLTFTGKAKELEEESGRLSILYIFGFILNFYPKFCASFKAFIGVNNKSLNKLLPLGEIGN